MSDLAEIFTHRHVTADGTICDMVIPGRDRDVPVWPTGGGWSKSFDPSQPRGDDGRWTGGGSAPKSVDHLRALAHGKVGQLLEHAHRIPADVMNKAKGKVQAMHSRLSKRYGPKFATAIIAAGIVGTVNPVPGSQLIAAAPIIAAAELYRALHGSKERDPDLGKVMDVAKKEWRKLMKTWRRQSADSEKQRKFALRKGKTYAERIECRFLMDDADYVQRQLAAHGDTNDYDCLTIYLDHQVPTWSLGIEGMPKFRLRQYSGQDTFLEEKLTTDGVGTKKRRKIEPENVPNDLVPVGSTRYTRTEFEDDNSRVTIDRNVVINGRAFGRIIVEVKGDIPDWLKIPVPQAIGFSKSTVMLHEEYDPTET